MSNLHPYWQTTDDEELPVRVTDKNVSVAAPAASREPAQSIRIPRAKRGPAALIGVALFLGMGFVLFQGANGLMSQVSSTDDDTVIRIAEGGVNPPVVTVKIGDTIRWENDSAIPHILESETLPSEDDESFMTSAIFPGDSHEYVIPTNITAGTHDYLSQTDADVMGQIIVEGGSAAISSSSRSSIRSSIAAVIVSSSSSSSISSIQIIQPSSVGGVPQNPHTIGGDTTLPPRQQPGTGIPSANTQGNVMEHMPSSTSSTGMGVWVTLISGLAAGAFVWRKSSN